MAKRTPFRDKNIKIIFVGNLVRDLKSVLDSDNFEICEIAGKQLMRAMNLDG